MVFLVLWGQIRLGLLKGSAEGSTKVPARFSKFRGVSGSLGQIRLGLPNGSAEGSTKVPARFHRGSISFVLSLVLWGDPSWPAKRWFHQGSAKVPPRFQQGCAKRL